MGFSQTSPYGSWKSPITADLVAGSEVGLEQIRFDGDDIYWIERRAQEGGRKVIVRRSSDGQSPISRRRDSMRARACTNTAAATTRCPTARSIFSNFADQRLYRQKPALTEADHARRARCATPTARSIGGEITMICVREDHTGARAKRSTRSCASILTATTPARSSSPATIFIRRRV